MLKALSLPIGERSTPHPVTGAGRRGCSRLLERQRNHPVTPGGCLRSPVGPTPAVPLINERSGRAAVRVPAPSFMLDDGEIERRVRLIRPMEQQQPSAEDDGGKPLG